MELISPVGYTPDVNRRTLQYQALPRTIHLIWRINQIRWMEWKGLVQGNKNASKQIDSCYLLVRPFQMAMSKSVHWPWTLILLSICAWCNIQNKQLSAAHRNRAVSMRTCQSGSSDINTAGVVMDRPDGSADVCTSLHSSRTVNM